MPRAFDPDKHCGTIGRRNGLPCTQLKGFRTNHYGAGRCWLHFGATKTAQIGAERELRFRQGLGLIAELTLAQIADKLARVAAAGALAVNDPDHDDFAKAVNAFAKAAERAEGTKVTLEGKLAILRDLPDGEVAAALEEIERLLAKPEPAA